MSLRTVRAGEADALAKLHARAFPGGGWSAGFFAGSMARGLDQVLVLGDPPRGLVILRTAGGEAEILTIAADPPRRGIGTVLLEGAVACAKASGAESLFLEVSVVNKAALHLYRKFGFTQVGLRRRYYDDGRDAALLRYDLSRKE